MELSVVVPVFGCADCLPELHRRLTAALIPLTTDYEILFVDDASSDGAWAIIAAMSGEDPCVRGLLLSRNFGQHAAITAGLAGSRGRWTVVMDCDLQEPPELIPRLYAKAQEGFDVVHTVRRRRQTAMRRLAGALYFRVRNAVLGTRTGVDHGTLSLLSRRVVDAFLRVGDVHREFLIVLDWLGFDQTTVEMQAADRHSGHSSYTFGRLTRVAIDGMFFQTTRLLRAIVAVGVLVALGGLALAAYNIYVYLTSDPPSGYTSLSVLILLMSGTILVSLGVVGLYVGKVFEQVKGRPLYLVEAEVGVAVDELVEHNP
ncbi:MAG: glycosyltransferase family 2 protein [Thermoleophilaceae bacterium]|nr:glycosyltransferase family 2 protein [Thermoleophilaceae bacterium]